MIKNTPFNTILIRISILFLRAITPAATILSVSSLICLILPSHWLSQPSGSSSFPTSKIILAAIFVLTVPEPLFYALVYVPRLRYLQKRTIPPEGNDLTRVEKRELARRFLGEVDDIRFWVGMWCSCGEGDGLKVSRSVVREWLAWGVLNRYSIDTSDVDDDEEELDEYLTLVEERLNKEGIVLEDDSNRTKIGGDKRTRKSIRVTIDPMHVLHRPLVYYVVGIGLIDSILFIKMWRLGFQHFPVRSNFQSFPWRPLSVLATERSPTNGLSYWYRPHTSKTRRPILYIHGIGVGLITYTDFFRDLIAKDTEPQDGQVGILAVEIMPISFRLTTSPIPPSEILARQIQKILHHHGWDKIKFVLAANSYGTIIATYLFRSPEVSPSIGPMILIDPVTLWAHMGDVAYNFTVRQPRSASEWQLWYFACTDIMAAHTVTRRFAWRENVLWRDEIAGTKVGVVLAGVDIILDAKRLRRFLVGDKKDTTRFNNVKGVELVNVDQGDRARDWEVLWFEKLNHAEVFEEQTERSLLVNMTWRYCLKQEKSQAQGTNE